MRTTTTGEGLIGARLKQRIPPGTVRRAEGTEQKMAEICWTKAGSLAELKNWLKTEPELPIITSFPENWGAVLRTVKESGASSICRVLVG